MSSAELTAGEWVRVNRDLDHAQSTIRELKAKLNVWDLDLTFEVIKIEDNFTIQVTAKKPNNMGFTFHLEPEDVFYYKDDQAELCNIFADKIIEKLYKAMIFDACTGPVSKAIQNISARGQ